MEIVPSKLDSQFSIALKKGKCCLIEERISANGFSWRWKQDPRNKAALTELLQLYLAIGDMEVPTDNFGLRFTINQDGRYTVDSMRRLIDSKWYSYTGPVIFWSKTIPLKVRCLVWRTFLNRIPVADTLVVRGIKVNNPCCALCDNESETANHLFSSCEFTRNVQDWIFKWCGLQPAHFTSTLEFIDFAASYGNCPRKRGILSSIFFCLIWRLVGQK